MWVCQKLSHFQKQVERVVLSEPGAGDVWGGVGVGGGSSLALPPGWRAAVNPLVPSGPRAILTA